MSEFASLLFGDGAILGFVILNALLFVVSAITSRGGLFSGVIGVLVFLFYLENIPAGTFEMWLPIAQALATLVFFLQGVKD